MDLQSNDFFSGSRQSRDNIQPNLGSMFVGRGRGRIVVAVRRVHERIDSSN